MPLTLQKLAEATGTRLVGDGNIEIARVASPETAAAGDLVFVESNRHLAHALESTASAVIVPESILPLADSPGQTKPLLVSQYARLAFAHAGALLHPRKSYPAGIHPTAVVSSTAKIPPSATVEAHAVIEAQAEIGERCRIGAGAYIGEGVKVADDCDLYPRVVVYQGTQLRCRVVVHAGAVLGSDGFGFVRNPADGRYHKFPQIGQLIIEDDVEIGANCTVDRGALAATVIGAGTKLDNMVHVGHNAQVGTNVVIAAQTGISGSSVLEDNVIVGGQVGIADHVRIEAGAILGAQSGIPSNKTIRGKGIVFWGTPARPIREYLKELAVLARLARKEHS